MMKPLNALIMAGTALVLGLLAVCQRMPHAPAERTLGEEFYPKFKEPEQAKSLRVVTFDPDTLVASSFEVEWKKDRWVIPTHHNYHADAEDRMAKTAGAVMDLKKGEVRTNRRQDHEACGVVDPEAPSTEPHKGRGQRITIKDGSRLTLADYIIGKEVEGSEGYRFVRLPGKNAVYKVKVNAEISTDFSDWINTDLLDVGGKIKRLGIRDYTVDERLLALNRISIKPNGNYALTRNKDSKWIMAGLDDTSEELNEDAIDDMTGTLKRLTIAGVRPASKLQVEKFLELKSVGIFPYQDKNGQDRLAANEGELHAETDGGVIYELYFGEIFLGSGLEVTAGTRKKKDREDKDKDKKGGKKDEDDVVRSRYLLVRARLSEDIQKKPTFEEFKPVPMPPKPKELDQPKPKDPKEAADWLKKKGDYEKLLSETEKRNTDAKKKAEEDRKNKEKEWEDKLDNARKKVLELNARFKEWYYVISDGDFQKLHLNRGKLVRVKTVNPADLPGEKVASDVPATEKKSGLRYWDIAVGQGESPSEDDAVIVNYTGWLADGHKQFDSGRKKSFSLKGVIKGWQEGLKTMKVGGRRKLYLPYKIAYGEAGSGENIPPRADLVFDVELLGIEGKK